MHSFINHIINGFSRFISRGAELVSVDGGLRRLRQRHQKRHLYSWHALALLAGKPVVAVAAVAAVPAPAGVASMAGFMCLGQSGPCRTPGDGLSVG